MQKLKNLGFLGLFLVQSVASATEIKGVNLMEKIQGESKTITKTGESYKPVELKRIAQGLRQKKVALFWASVYVAQVFSNTKADFGDINKLRESIAAELPATVTMTFVRDVGIDKIVDGYKDVFKENGVKTEEEPFKGFLAAVKNSGDVKDRQTYQFNFLNDGAGKFELKFLNQGKEQYAAKGLDRDQLESFLKMWFGKAADSGLEQLQEHLLKPNEKI